MKQVVIEIDGVRHRLVPDTEIPKAECMMCSMQKFCYTCEVVSGLCLTRVTVTLKRRRNDLHWH